MNSEFVDGIVAQIRKRIAQEHAQEASSRNGDSPAPDYRERMAEDSRCFGDIETQIDAAAARIGENTSAPPAGLGRFHLWVVSLLQRTLWWYTKPIQETVELLNRRNREQAVRHFQMQEQILSLMTGLQQTVHRTESLEMWQQDVEGQLWELRSNQTALQSQLHFVAERAAKQSEKLREQLEKLSGAQRQRSDNLWSQIEGLKKRLQEQQSFNAMSDSIRVDFEQRLTEVARAFWSRLPVLETQLQVEADARKLLAVDINSQVVRLEQDLRTQTAELTAGLQDLQSHAAVSDSLRAAMTQRVSDAAHATWDRLQALEAELRGEAGEREALTKQMEDRFQELQAPDAEEPVTSLYAEFEDLFRGPREEIKERLKIYLPRIQQSNAGSLEAPVLDLGCGRGEWLQLLSEHDFVARGVDMNPVMVSRCCELGLGAVEADALAYLKSLPDRSLGAITSFHMIEHVPFETLMVIVDEALRVLQSGGLLILETPNPRNVLVGSQTFWIDPTHIHPVLSQTLRFFLEARGFCQLEVLNLHPYPETEHVPEESGVAHRFNEYFYGPQDYCIIGCRP